jgi:hypothetical protein
MQLGPPKPRVRLTGSRAAAAPARRELANLVVLWPQCAVLCGDENLCQNFCPPELI